MSSPAIETRGLTKHYRDTTALDNLDLTVRDGELYGLLGPNGAGKSTTISLLMDYTRPTAGTATVLGYDPWTDVVDLHEHVGVLPDRFSLYDRLSARQHLTLFIETKGADDTPRALLERVGLADAIDDTVDGYSRGMEQRLALAMALVGSPELLILDEPFSGLDPLGVKQLRTTVSAESERGTTVLFSSHVLGQVELVCDRIGIIHDGTLVAEGKLDSLREQYHLGDDASMEEIYVKVLDESAVKAGEAR